MVAQMNKYFRRFITAASLVLFLISKDPSIYSFFLGGVFFSQSDSIQEEHQIANIKFMYFFFFLVILGAFSYGQIPINALWVYSLFSTVFFLALYFINFKKYKEI